MYMLGEGVARNPDMADHILKTIKGAEEEEEKRVD
jgi:hypothetical protein